MNGPESARKNLEYMDPAEFTPQFAWRSARDGKVRSVFCEGVPLEEIAAEFGTPTYVYSQQAIEDAFDELEEGLKRLPHLLCFAVKANGNLSILKLLAKRGSGFDIVSGGELEHLGHIAVPGERIVFSGVGKTRQEIREGLSYRAKKRTAPGILQFNVESHAELELLLEEASRSGAHRGGVIPGVSIRVNPDVKAGGHPHISTGLANHKFGMCWDEARGLYLQHRNSRHIRWQGISSHIGSQIVDAEPFHEALTRMAAHLGELRKEGIALKYLDFGGGLGVRYTNEAPVSRGDYARMVAEMVQPLGVGLLLEPGRSIVASAGVLLSRVLYTKRNAVKAFVVVDAAMNDFARPVLYDAPHPITRVSVRGELATPEERVDIVGPVCESGDSFLQGWPIGHLEAGEVVAIWGAGAYGMVQASNYNGRCRPAEVMVKGKRVQLIRRRETMRDVLRTDVLG